MNTAIKYLSDPVWFTSVVVCGIIVSIIGAYLKQGIDKLGTWLFPRMVGFVRKDIEAFGNEVAALRASSERRVETQLLKIEYLVKIIGAFFAAVYLNVLASLVIAPNSPRFASVLRVVAFFAAMYVSACIGRYGRFATLLNQARRTGS